MPTQNLMKGILQTENLKKNKILIKTMNFIIKQKKEVLNTMKSLQPREKCFGGILVLNIITDKVIQVLILIQFIFKRKKIRKKKKKKIKVVVDYKFKRKLEVLNNIYLL